MSAVWRWMETEERELSYEELMARKLDAIERLDFEEASWIQEEIDNRKSRDFGITIKSASPKIQSDIQNAYNKYIDRCEKAKRVAADEDLVCREKIDLSFQEWQRKHLEELVKIEKEFALELLKAKSRPVKEQLDLIEQAKRLARLDDFDQSILMRQKAEAAYEAEMASRKKAVHEKFKTLRLIALEHQKNDLAVLNKRLSSMLENVKSGLEASLENEKRKLMAQLRSLQQKAVSAVVADLRNAGHKKVAAEKINDYFNQQVCQIAGFALNEATPAASPMRERTGRSSRASSNRLTAHRPEQATPRGSECAEKEDDESKFVDE